MNKILELREKRAKAWEAAKAFLDTKRGDNGLLSAEDTAVYEKMEADVVSLGREIDRLERQAALDAELDKTVNTPIKGKPSTAGESKTGRASDEYKKAFWNVMRSKAPHFDVVNALQIGTDSEGAIPESDDAFGQVSIGAYKLATMMKVSEELLNDSVFNLESYISKEFARRIGHKEEEAFFTGDGTGKPTGILAATGGGTIGVTAASATAITLDEVMDLFYALKSPYRRNAVFLMNDATVKAIRKLKDGNGQYLWQPSVTAGTPDTILNRPVMTSAYVPAISASAKTIAFGDFSYYWIADRQGRSFKRLNELYAATGQVGFMATQRVDGKLVLAEAVQILQQKTSA